MRISIISNYTFASSLPDDLKAIHQYGSESMTAILAHQLAKNHQVEFHAPVGSSRIGAYHPTRRTDGSYLPSDLLHDISLDGSKTEGLANSEFVIDCTPWANNIVELALYNDYHKYLCYRLGYKDYDHPNLSPQLKHHITHCQYFADLYEQAGYPNCQVAHFGISDFWSRVSEDEVINEHNDIVAIGRHTDAAYWNELRHRYRLGTKKSNGAYRPYYLYPHRYNREKGAFEVIRLAKDFPKETFVLSSAAVLPDHMASLEELRAIAPPNCKFVQLPSTPDREFYRRELYRNAICTLSPFHNLSGYHDTGGILSMESIKCGTPVICTRSPGSEEILGHQEDAGVYFMDGYESLKLLIKYVDFLSAKPAPWKWTIDNYVNEYMKAIDSIIN